VKKVSDPWRARAERARILTEKFPASGEILAFYAALATWQSGVAGRIHGFRDIVDVAPSLLEMVRPGGPRPLSKLAAEMTADEVEALTRQYWESPKLPTGREFFARALLELYAAILPPGIDCPWCSFLPQVGVLRSQGDGLALELVCALCFRSRAYPRGQCPSCEEASESRLATYTAAEVPHLRLSACDACRGYLTTVDLSVDPEAIPEVDELVGLPLDLWAVGQGYRKLQPNIVGV
jgi:formate dehydrogenase maturation protein FdhE